MMIRLLLRSFLFFLIISTALGCSGGQYENEATENLGTEDKMHYEQYMVQGTLLYNTNCSNCHQEDGTGLRRLIPPLADSDYLLEDEKRVVCLMKHGVSGHILVNGIDYNQKMPDNEHLTDIEIAQIATFILNSWGNQKGYLPVKEVSAYVDSCR